MHTPDCANLTKSHDFLGGIIVLRVLADALKMLNINNEKLYTPS